MQVKQKLCGAWRKHGHVLMSCSRGFFVTGAGFVIRRISAVVRRAVQPLKYHLQKPHAPTMGEYPPPKNAHVLGEIYVSTGYLWFSRVGTRDFSFFYRVKPVSHAHLIRVV